MAKFPYLLLPTLDGKGVYKPLVQIRLSYPKTHKVTDSVWGLIDSGADVCFCQKDIGIWLGINFKHKKSVSFSAANKETFITVKETIILYVCGKRYNSIFYFAEKLAYPIIFGQIGFFDRFRISFDLKNKEIEIA